jgi:hypothetical protein
MEASQPRNPLLRAREALLGRLDPRMRGAIEARLTPLAIEGALVVVLGLAILLFSAHGRSTAFNNYIRVADAWRHGHTWIDYPGRWLDAVEYKGQHYGVDAPFPALLALPFVLIWGAQTNQTMLAIAVATLGLFAAWRLLLRLGVTRVSRVFLIVFLFAGTDYWWCAELGDVWFLAHLCALTATLLAMLELLGKRRAWLIALYTVAAVESRNTALLSVPFMVYMFGSGDFARAAAAMRGENPDAIPRVNEFRGLRQIGVVFGVTALLWVGLNEAMWGTITDIGHTIYYHQDTWGSPTGSPFGLRYLPYQIYSFFFRPPELVQWLQAAQAPFLKVDPNGVALTFTSPALVLAFFARKPAGIVRWLWITAALVAVPDFLYYLNGWYQFGMRHALDFMPFLFVLMAIACRERMPKWGMTLIVYSAIAGTWGVWWWGTYMRTGD